jgi:lipopolysaccharide export system protein LptA
MKSSGILLRLVLFLILAIAPGLGRAQTNTPAAKASEPQELSIDSDSMYFDGLLNQAIYMGHVHVTDHVKATLTCERLTVYLPANGGNPTNIVAETNVVADVLDQKGTTNHITADKAVYSYTVVTNSAQTVVTNEIVTFTGDNPMPELTNPQAWISADPIILDVPKRSVSFPQRVKMKFKETTGSGTNRSPFQILQ